MRFEGVRRDCVAELGLALALGGRAHDVVVQARRQRVGLDLGDEAVAIGLLQRLRERRCLFDGAHAQAPVSFVGSMRAAEPPTEVADRTAYGGVLMGAGL